MRTRFMILACSVLASASVARAAEPDVAALQQQVRQLSQRVLELQQRVDRLEGRRALPPPAAPVSSAPPEAAVHAVAPGAGYVSPEAALKASWHRIRADMAESEVVALLGAPSKKFTLDGRRGWYYYYPGTGVGSVFFTDAGRVSSRQSPFGLGW
jgi:hypothetical protein